MTTLIEVLPRFPVNTGSAATGTQNDPHIIGLSNGNFLVAWEEAADGAIGTSRGTDIIGKLFSADGRVIRDSFRINGGRFTDDEMDFDIAATNDGGWILVYVDNAIIVRDRSSIIVERALSDGTRVISAFDELANELIPVDTLSEPAVAVDLTDNSFVVTFTDFSGGNRDVRGARFDANHTPGAIFDAARNTLARDANAEVANLANGNFVSVYHENGTPSGIEARIFRPDGTEVTTLELAMANAAGAKVTALANGNFVVLWQVSVSSPDTLDSNPDIQAQVFDPRGNAISGVIEVTATETPENEGSVVALPQGGFVVFWDNHATDTVVARAFYDDGTPNGDPTTIATNGTDLDIGVTADGRVLFTWKGVAVREIFASVFAVPLHGTDAAETLNGSTRAEVIRALGGNDLVNGRGGQDTIEGGAGADTLRGFAQGERMLGGTGNDSLLGFGGNDSLFGNNDFDRILGGNGNDYINGGAGNDLLQGENHNDRIFGGDGNDTIRGGNHNDVLFGNANNDVLSGDDGDDSLDGGTGADQLNGGRGDDTIVGGHGADVNNGGSQTDLVDYSASAGAVRLNMVTGGTQGDANGDTFIGIENIIGTTVGDNIAGNDLENMLDGRGGFDVIDGRGGNDTVMGGAGGDTLLGGGGSDVIQGETGQDLLRGGDGGDLLQGGASNDILFGDAGNDTLEGGQGSDIEVGGSGSDLFIGGSGADVLVGSSGVDTVTYANSAAVRVNLITGGTRGDAAGDVYNEIENVIGTSGADLIEGDGLNNRLSGENGNDTLFGGDGNDILQGLAHSDVLNGGDGRDLLIGGAGSDRLSGGAGLDQYRFNANETGSNTIHDYALGEAIQIVRGNGRAPAPTFAQIGDDARVDYGAGVVIVENTLVGDLNIVLM